VLKFKKYSCSNFTDNAEAPSVPIIVDIPCPDASVVQAGSVVAVRVNRNLITHADFGPNFFGFNLELVGFQQTYWNATSRTVRPAIVGWLQPFRGAIYRYPGGTVSNYFDWRTSVGPLRTRPAVKLVAWLKPAVIDFGFDEYLAFVHQVGGVPWVVANLYGTHGQEVSAAEMVRSNGAWAAYAKSALASKTPVLRWELGNELDRGGFKWSPQKYADEAKANAAAISAGDYKSKYVAMLEDYSAYNGMSEDDYDSTVINSLPRTVNEFAQHDYYDGAPEGPSVPNRIAQVCHTASLIDSIRLLKQAKIWVTENARWPSGDPSSPTWQQQWRTTTNLDGALSLADFLIGMTQLPEVQGVFMHTLGGAAGPWQLFQQRVSDKSLYPSVAYWVLRTLREGMLDTVLQTSTVSPNNSAYTGGYDIRATVMTDPKSGDYSLWVVNRAHVKQAMRVYVPPLAKITVFAQDTFVASSDETASNNDDNPQNVMPLKISFRLHFDSTGMANIVLPPNSVSSILLERPKR